MDYCIDSPIGKLGLTVEDNSLTKVNFLSEAFPIKRPNDTNGLKIIYEFEQYFGGHQKKLNIPIKVTGTAFQQKVWDALQQIPFGTTETYGQLAEKLKTSARAIGNACRTNPTPIIVPCHRIVAANSPGGYGGQRYGDSLQKKSWLLKHEIEQVQ